MDGKGWNQRLVWYRLVAAYSVVWLHIRFPGWIGVAVNCLARFGVPLFFLSAGYYSQNRSASVLLRRGLRIGGLFLLACLPSLALGVLQAVQMGEPLTTYWSGWIHWTGLQNLLLIQQVPLPYSWHLWFLVALMWIDLLWAGVEKVRQGRQLPTWAILWTALGLLALHLALGEGAALLGRGEPINGLFLRNAWLDGLPFFLLGMVIAEEREWLAGWVRGWMLWGLWLLGGTLALVSRSQTGFLDLHFGSVLMACAMMMGAALWPGLSRPLSPSQLDCWSDVSLWIYLLHIPLYGLIKELSWMPGIAWVFNRPWVMPWAVALGATLLALGIHKGKRWLQRGRRGG